MYFHQHGLRSPAACSCGNRNQAYKPCWTYSFCAINFSSPAWVAKCKQTKIEHYDGNYGIGFSSTPLWIFLGLWTPPPTPLEYFQFLLWGEGVWIFSGTTHCKNMCYILKVPLIPQFFFFNKIYQFPWLLQQKNSWLIKSLRFYRHLIMQFLCSRLRKVGSESGY